MIRNLISKQLIFRKKGIFVLFLIFLYIAMVMYALPLGLIPSMAISSMAPLSVFLITYPTYCILLPRFTGDFENRANMRKYLLLSLLLIVIVMSFIWLCLVLLFDAFGLPWDGFSEGYSIVRFLNPSLFIVTYIFCNVFYVHNRHHDYMNMVANEKKELEMKVLKSQINTHFLHNALNNIYSMIYFENKEDAAKYVMKLSQMLRYVLDDCEEEYVPIAKEVVYIENYIAFQKARFDTGKDIRFSYIHSAQQMLHIPPMIFQPLIENCFKYCPLEKEGSYVRIELEANNSQVRFVCENTRNDMEQSSGKKGSGIGIENLNKRLKISYKKNYSLDISEEQDLFKVELIINSYK
jgi:Putative regulator of cell autolysis